MESMLKTVLLLSLACSSKSQNMTTQRPPTSGLASLIIGGADLFRNQLIAWQRAFNNALTLAGNGISLGSRLTNQGVNGWSTAAKDMGNTAIQLASSASNGGTNITRQGIDILTSLAAPIPVLGNVLDLGGNIGSTIVGGSNAAAQTALATGQGLLNTKTDLINNASLLGTDLLESGAKAVLEIVGNAGNTGFDALHSGLNNSVAAANASLETANGILTALNAAADSFANSSNSAAAAAMANLQSGLSSTASPITSAVNPTSGQVS